MLATLLLSSFNLPLFVKPSFSQKTSEKINSDVNSSIEFSENEGHEHSSEDPLTEGIERNKASGSLSQTPDYQKDKWNFNDTSEWSKHVYLNGNHTRLIIGLSHSDAAALQKLEQTAAKYQAKIVNKIVMGGHVKAVAVELLLSLVSPFVNEVRSLGLASYIEPNMKVQAFFVPNDPYWSLQWGPQKIQADWAWNTTTGDSSVLVAVVDTGIYYTHPDIAPNYTPLGYDWANMDADPIDDHGHGTHCAGIIAAVLNNSIGIAGLARVRLMAEKVLSSDGMGYWDWVANGIINATDCGADIISMSLGGYGESELVHDAVKYAYASGVLVVAAAGNDGSTTKAYPAAYDEVVAVVATDQYDAKASFSNWGDWIELAAPGVSIYSTVPWGYESWSGTSMACPHVSGVAALVMSKYPAKNRDWVRLWLRYTADDLGDAGFDQYYGYGRINARKAVETSAPEHELIAYGLEAPAYVEPNSSAKINASVLNFGDSDETNVLVQLLANSTVVDTALIDLVPSGGSAKAVLTLNTTVPGFYNLTVYFVPVEGETNIENNVLFKTIGVGHPVKAFVLHSAGNVISEIIANWQVLNNEWYQFGSTMVYVDYTTLNKMLITYEDLVASEADVLIISCAYNPLMGWEFTDQEIEAIQRYVQEGHGLIGTAGTLYDMVPNNNKLAPLFGINKSLSWTATTTTLLHLLNKTHPLFAGVPNPLVFPSVGTVVSYDGRWDSNELAGGKYAALGHFQESAIVTYRGLVYITPWLEIIPPYYYHHLQLLYNAIVWSRYQKPAHELTTTLQCPLHSDPGKSIMLNATVTNFGQNNETDVELHLLIDNLEVANLTVPILTAGESATLQYLWTPTMGTYNVTAYSPAKPDEEDTANNVVTVYSKISYAAVIGFVETHGESLHSESLKTFYESLGHIVVTIRSTLTPDLLSEFDILIIGDDWYNNPWQPAEVNAVKSFIDSGGGFVGVGDELGNVVQQIIGYYGIGYTGFYGVAGSSNNFDHYHPLMIGVNSIYASYPVNTLRAATPAYWIANDAANANMLIAAAEVGGTVLCLSDDFAADLYLDDNEIMFANLVDWAVATYEHELAVNLKAPTFLEPSTPFLLKATVKNHGINNETNVDLYLIINGAIVNYTLIPELWAGESYTIDYYWVPTVEGYYNVTAYSTPVAGEAKTSNNICTANVRVRSIIARVAILDSWDIPPYFIGGWSNDYQVLVDALNQNGFYASAVTNDDIIVGALDAFDVFVLIDNVPNEAAVPHVVNFWLNNGGIVAFDSSICFLCYAGILPPESAGNNGYYTYWNYGSSGTAQIVAEHPVTAGYEVGQIVGGAGGDAEYWVEALSKTIAYPYYTQLAEDAKQTFRAVVSAYEPQTEGKVVHIWDYSHWRNSVLQRMILNAVEWAFAVQYEHDLVTALQTPAFVKPGSSTVLNATVRNIGMSNETDVTLWLLINDTLADYANIPLLPQGDSFTLRYNWTPSAEGIYNITAYVVPVPNEERIINNVATNLVKVASVKYVLFDQTHGADSISYYSTWITSLTARNYVVDTLTVTPITLEILWPYDVFVIPQAHSSYSTDELEAIKEYVRSGGGLLVIGDDNPSLYTNLTSFAGISWAFGGLGGETSDITLHPVTAGVTTVYLYSPITYLNVAGSAEGLVRDYEKEIMLAVSECSGGKVIGFADEDTLGNYGIILADNLLLANNMIDWLPSPRVEHDVAITDIKVSADKVMLGETVIVNVTASNQGDVAESFNVTAYASSANSTRVYLDPSEYLFNASSIYVGYRFNVTVWINSTEPYTVMMWQVFLSYNDKLINATRQWNPPTESWVIRGWPNTNFNGRNWDSAYLFYGLSGGVIGDPVFMPAHASPIGLPAIMIGDIIFSDINASGEPKKLCTIEFEIKALPAENQTLSSVLDIDNSQTFVYNFNGEVPIYKYNGYYAVTSGTPPPPPPPPANYVLGTATIVALAPGENVTVSFAWNTSEVTPHEYAIWAEASPVLYERDTADNKYFDGTIKVTKYPVASFSYCPASPKPGEPVTFDASASLPDGGVLVNYTWNFGDGNSTTVTEPVVTHTYAAGNIYNVTLTVTDSEGLNASTWKLVCVLTRDVALVKIDLSTNQTYVGHTININVTVANQGEMPETFTVTIYCNNTFIESQIIHDLSPETNITLAFNWSTLGLVPNANYIIHAEVLPVPFEVDLDDNMLVDGTVRIKLLGDVNGDGAVTMLDLYLVALHFGFTESNGSWNPEADLNLDGIINMVDLYLVASNF
ncbi:MAG: S8 family serine peptidase, partial [Candidatus Bathyarchaeia archaeon]